MQPVQKENIKEKVNYFPYPEDLIAFVLYPKAFIKQLQKLVKELTIVLGYRVNV